MLEYLKLVVSVGAVVIASASFLISLRSAAKAKRAEAITHLLGEKETVAFAALKLLRDGLPSNEKERALVLSSLLQACIFEGSSRARALLYRVIEVHRAQHREELRVALSTIKETFENMDRYAFEGDELDLSHGRRRLAAVERVVEDHEKR